MAKVLPDPLADAVGEALFRYGQSEDYDGLPGSEAAVALAAIPDGWAKVDGKWLRLERAYPFGQESAAFVGADTEEFWESESTPIYRARA